MIYYNLLLIIQGRLLILLVLNEIGLEENTKHFKLVKIDIIGLLLFEIEGKLELVCVYFSDRFSDDLRWGLKYPKLGPIGRNLFKDIISLLKQTRFLNLM